MASQQPASLTTNPPPPFRPNSPSTPSTCTNTHHNHESHLHHSLSSIRTAIARENILFGGAKVKRSAVAERVEGLRRSDESDRERSEATQHADQVSGSTQENGVVADRSELDPSRQAQTVVKTDGNGMQDS